MKEYIDEIRNYCLANKFNFSNNIIRRYWTSLKSKPFVILSGISGTGKTKIAQLFNEFMSNNNKEQYAFISVRPDWKNNTGLLGFHNIITDKYSITPFLKLILRASTDYNKNKTSAQPYFVVLDEMNLSKVEYYFSDFLSCLESRKYDVNGKLIQEKMTLHNNNDFLYDNEDSQTANFNNVNEYYIKDNNKSLYRVPAEIEIPPNIYFTGTVNIDETTYMFSSKVLDRANVIIFNEVQIEEYLKQKEEDSHQYIPQTDVTEIVDEFTNSGEFLQLKTDFISDKSNEIIIDVFNILKKYEMHFGYRVIDEIFTYLKNSYNFDENFEDGKYLEYIDEQIAQKVLPKFHGDNASLNRPVNELLDYLNNKFEKFQSQSLSIKLLQRLKINLDEKGFASAIF
jgi:hypoxanthine phosphoribosyltransferase